MIGKIFMFVTITLTGIIAGLHVGSLFYFNPAADLLPLREQILMIKSMEIVFNPSIAIIMATMNIVSLITLFFLKKRKRLFRLFLFATICLTIQTITTLTVNVPINNLVAKMSLNAIPTDWEMIRARWNVFNMLRTMLLMAAFFSYLTSLIFISEDKKEK